MYYIEELKKNGVNVIDYQLPDNSTGTEGYVDVKINNIVIEIDYCDITELNKLTEAEILEILEIYKK